VGEKQKGRQEGGRREAEGDRRKAGGRLEEAWREAGGRWLERGTKGGSGEARRREKKVNKALTLTETPSRETPNALYPWTSRAT